MRFAHQLAAILPRQINRRPPPRLRIYPLGITFEHQIRFTPTEPANPVNVHRDLMRLLSSFVAIRAGTLTCGIHDPAPRRKRIQGSAHHLVSILGVGFHAGSRRTTGKCSNDSNCHCVSHATSGPFARILPRRAKRVAIVASAQDWTKAQARGGNMAKDHVILDRLLLDVRAPLSELLEKAFIHEDEVLDGRLIVSRLPPFADDRQSRINPADACPGC